MGLFLFNTCAESIQALLALCCQSDRITAVKRIKTMWNKCMIDCSNRIWFTLQKSREQYTFSRVGFVFPAQRRLCAFIHLLAYSLLPEISLKYGWWEGVECRRPLLPPLHPLCFRATGSSSGSHFPPDRRSQQLGASLSGHLYTFPLHPCMNLGTVKNTFSQTGCVMNALASESSVP